MCNGTVYLLWCVVGTGYRARRGNVHRQARGVERVQVRLLIVPQVRRAACRALIVERFTRLVG